MNKPCYRNADNRMSTPTCSAHPLRNSLIISLYSPAHSKQDDGEEVYPSNCKPIPLLEAIEQSEKVLYDDSPAAKSDTFDDQTSASTKMMPCSVVSEERNNKPEVCVLPINFSPHPYSVICGRGKVRKDTPGNRYLQSIAERYMLKYSQAQHSRKEKSSIVSHILGTVRGDCPDGRGAFIRAEKNRWIELSELEARDKISSVMRNGLQSKYKSSTKSKVAKRRHHNKAKKNEIDMNFWDDCSKHELVGPTSKYYDDEGLEVGPTSKYYDDEVFDLLFREDLFREGFFE
jgi:hypothetical protein